MPKDFKPTQGYEEGERPAIALLPVDSNQVGAVGYDAATKTLAVQFKRGEGAIYHYADIEPETHAALIGAESIGKHFGAHIQGRPFKKYPKPQAVEA